MATQLRADGVDVRLDHWHTVPGDQLPEFMEREIGDNDYVIVVCTPKYKTKSDGRTGGVGYEGDIMTAEVLAKKNHRKFIPVLARGTWTESAPSWLTGKRYVELSDPVRYAKGYNDLLATILGTGPKPPPLGPLPSGYEPSVDNRHDVPVSSAFRSVNLGLYDRRLPIYKAAVRLIEYVVRKGTCTFEELDRFSNATEQARFLFNEDIESYLRKLQAEALYITMGEEKRALLDPTSDEHYKSMSARGDRIMWFNEQVSEVTRRFDPFLKIQT